MRTFRKLLTVFVLLMLFNNQTLFVCAEETFTAASFVYGDVNGDNKISALDYVGLKKYLNDSEGKEAPASYDANNDGHVDEYDLLRIKNIVYYGEIDNLNVSVSSKTIHTPSQRSFIQEGYTSISKYANSGGYPAQAIRLDFDGLIGSGASYTVRVSDNYDMSNARSFTTYNRYYDFENGLVHKLYFWTVSNGSQTSSVQSFYVDDKSPRNLSYRYLENLRDIGGYETDDGMFIRQGMIYRGFMLSNDGSLNRNRDFLKNELGIRSEIDLAQCTYLLNAENYYSYPLSYPISGSYLNPAYNGSTKNSIIKIFDVLGDESNYPIYIHCHIGTDRTGFLCFLMNALCGVSKEDCYMDYVFSGFAGKHRAPTGLDGNPISLIEACSGRTFAEKTYNLLVKRGVNPESLDNFISIMKEKKPGSKSYISVPEPISTMLKYDGSEKQLRFKDDYLFNVEGDTATNVGEYVATVSLKDPYTYSWPDGSKSDKQFSWTIEDVRERVSKPEVDVQEYVYDGEEKEVFVEEKEYYVISGNKAKDAGEYEITISLTDKSEYVWEDESNDDLNFSWSIDKADIDMSQISFEDVSYEYDGIEKTLTYDGELPKGIKSVVYTDNVMIGDPYRETSTQASVSFVLENDNYNPVEDMTAVLTILPIYHDLTVDFDAEGLETMDIVFGEEYSLPVLEKEGFTFDGWYVQIGDEFIKVASEGVWEYEVDDSDVDLIPVFIPIEGGVQEESGEIDPASSDSGSETVNTEFNGEGF